MKKSALPLCILLGLLPFCVKAQTKFQILLDYHYNLGFSEKGYNYHIYRNSYRMHGNSLHLSVVYRFTPSVSIGGGIGADRYEEPGYNTFPVFAIIHYTPAKKRIPNAYLYTNLGYAIEGSNSSGGLLYDIGIGYKKMFRKHFGLNFQFGYNLKQFKTLYFYPTPKNRYDTRQSLSFGFGFIF